MLMRYKYTAKSAKGFVHHSEDIDPANIEAIAAETYSLTDDLISHFDKAFPNTATRKVLHALQTSREAAYATSAH